MSVAGLRPDVRQLAQNAEDTAFAWMINFDPDADGLADDIPTMIGAYVQSAAILAADWYNSQGGSAFSARAVEVDPERYAATAEWVFKGPQRPENRMRMAAAAMVFAAARETVWVNAEAEGVSVARHEGAGACNDCMARATVTPKARDGGSEDVARDFHHSCDGLFVPVRQGVYEPPSHARLWAPRIAAARRAGRVNVEDVAKWLSTH